MHNQSVFTPCPRFGPNVFNTLSFSQISEHTEQVNGWGNESVGPRFTTTVSG